MAAHKNGKITRGVVIIFTKVTFQWPIRKHLVRRNWRLHYGSQASSGRCNSESRGHVVFCKIRLTKLRGVYFLQGRIVKQLLLSPSKLRIWRHLVSIPIRRCVPCRPARFCESVEFCYFQFSMKIWHAFQKQAFAEFTPSVFCPARVSAVNSEVCAKVASQIISMLNVK